MRCPKCHYLSFEPESRCRNCGYDFALAEAPRDDEGLSIKAAEVTEASLADLDLRERTPGPRPIAPVTLALNGEWQPAESRASEAPTPALAVALAVADPPATPVAPLEAAPAPRVVPPRAPTTTTELPLFVRGLPPPALPAENAAFDVAAAPSPPIRRKRPPLAVRRRAPEPAPTSQASQAAPLARLTSPFSGLTPAKPAKTEPRPPAFEIPQSDSVWAASAGG